MKLIGYVTATFLGAVFLFLPGTVKSQYARPAYWNVGVDTVSSRQSFFSPFKEEPKETRLQRIYSSNAFQITYIPVGLFALAAISVNNDDYVRAARNYNIPGFRHSYDDYLQYAPGVLTYALKAFGVEGRSSWGRLVTSTAISSSIMAVSVNSLKYTVRRPRPDNSANNSFPSGHAAMSFTLATWLHKEYGVTRSPLYSIFGYATATTIAISRVMNNKHWLSDVLTGAGIGILSSNLGYYLGDLLYGERGISSRAINQALPPTDFNPSFWNVSSGYSLFNSRIEISEETTIKANQGFYIGSEGAYFFTPYIGFGGKISVNTHTLDVNKSSFLSERPDFQASVDYIQPGSSSVYQIYAGPYFSYPISRRLYFNAKLIGGYACSSASEILFIKKKQAGEMTAEEVVGYKSKSDQHFGFESGAALVTMVARNMGIRFFTDYSVSITRPVYAEIKDINAGVPSYSPFRRTRDATQNVIVGIGINAYFQ